MKLNEIKIDKDDALLEKTDAFGDLLKYDPVLKELLKAFFIEQKLPSSTYRRLLGLIIHDAQLTGTYPQHRVLAELKANSIPFTVFVHLECIPFIGMSANKIHSFAMKIEIDDTMRYFYRGRAIPEKQSKIKETEQYQLENLIKLRPHGIDKHASELKNKKRVSYAGEKEYGWIVFK